MGQFRAIMRRRGVSNNERLALQNAEGVESDWNLEGLANGPLDDV
jgi:hypothetical protein